MNKSELIKKIIIGSANFELPYGVAQRKIDNFEKNKIINFAKSKKIFTIDTAEGYQDNSLFFNKIDKRFKFITKIKPDKKWISLEFCKKKIKAHFQSFKGHQVQALLIHDIRILYSKFGSSIYKNLLILKKKKFFKKIGISIYDPRSLSYLVSKYNFDIVQCPFNILDRRIIKSGWFNKLKKKNIEIHARSVFLQGLLLDKKIYKKKFFKEWNKYFSKWFEQLDKNDISPLQYCLNDLCMYDFNKIIIGINSKDNLKEIVNFKLLKKNLIIKNLKINDLKLIDPRRWKK